MSSASRPSASRSAGSRRLLALVSSLLAFLVWSPQPSAQGAAGVHLRSLNHDPDGGTARAVIVEHGALVHTALMHPEDRSGRLLGGDDASAQARQVLANIATALDVADTSLDHLVRLHVYVADASVTPHVEALLAARFGTRDRKPAVTFVETAMPRPGVLVAMDAIAATGWEAASGELIRLAAEALPLRTVRGSHVAVQPAGPFVTVSGRAARGEFVAAVRETIAQLRADLDIMGLTFDHVVQVKSFLSDMRRVSHLEEIVADVFEGDRVPPQVVTEWRQDAVPAEIEVIATAPLTAHQRPRVEHVEPIAGRYSRIARANAGRPVFLSGLYGRPDDSVAQVDDMFGMLKGVLQEAGSDMRHLVKATYYVSDTAADARINTIRPTAFDPERPPAASKLSVRGTGRPGKGSTFDLIAVTTSP